MIQTECRFFNGYKPCGKSSDCSKSCLSLDIPMLRICIIHLGAVGAVLRATSLLPAIKRKYPSSHITWVTDSPSGAIFLQNRYVDRVFETSFESLLELKSNEYDIVFVIDKSAKAVGILEHIEAEQVFGFVKNRRSGAIIPANSKALELWELGLDNDKKFFQNKKPETQLMNEAFELAPFKRDEYQLSLAEQETEEVDARRASWSAGVPLIGINTGCSQMLAYRKFTVEFTRVLIEQISQKGLGQVVLLGGPGETLRNREIASGLDVVQSSTDLGLRDGILSAAACDIIISGDSLGMHLGIALKKWVVAWFGPTCAQEIDLYGRGMKVKTSAGCSPCWKRNCEKELMCYDLVELDELLSGIEKGTQWLKKSSFCKPLLSEICY